MKKKILFVDDDIAVREEMHRQLSLMLKHWDMVFADSGKEALSLMHAQSFDAVVSDARMPEIDGMELLNEVSRLYPNMVRFVLCDQFDKSASLRAARVAHQVLTKPCNAQEMAHTIEQACELSNLLANESLRQIVLQIRTFPSMPRLYYQVLEELLNEHPSLNRIGMIIRKDVGMSTKILQLANSAIFGLSHRVSDPAHAAALVGIDSLKSLILLTHIFSEFQNIGLPRSYIDALWNHSLTIGKYAHIIAKAEGLDARNAELTFTAGLLHDTGKLILAINMPERYREVIRKAQSQRMPIEQVEIEVFGASHAEVGGFLLRTWGLPVPIIGAAVFHHHPSRSLCTKFEAMVAVHVAHLFQDFHGTSIIPIEADAVYMKRLGLEDHIKKWEKLCRSASASSDKNIGHSAS